MAGLNPAAQNVVNVLANQPSLLMKMRILSLGKNYDVMDPNQQVLCHVGLDAGQNVGGEVVKGAIASIAGDYLGRYAARDMTYTYRVTDAAGNLALEIRKGAGANQARFDVFDPLTNVPVGSIQLRRSLIGGLQATWLAPNGQPLMQTQGNVIRRTYAIRGPDGREIGRVRHKILAIRDVWQLEFGAGTNHLYSAIFATILDFEKEM
jgi:uncharacterized protein YxjI